MEVFTHINHAFAWPNEQGEIEANDGMFDASIVEHVHNNNRKILISLGGWGNADGFASATFTHELRSVLISNILDLFVSYGYDGVDIDWEYPQTNEQRNNLTLFIAELDSVLDEFDPELLITMALRMKFSYDTGLNQNGFRCVISANQNDFLNQSFLSRYWGFCWLELVNLNGQKWTKTANQHAFY